MKVQKIVAITLILSIVVSLTGCQNPISMVKGLFSDENQAASTIIDSSANIQGDELLRDTVLYYKDDKGFLVPVMRKIPWTEGIAKATLGALVDTPANREDIDGIGLMPVIPANTEINGMNIENGLCKVDFTSEFLNYGSLEEEEALVKAVVYTLTEFVTIDSVQLMINGKSPQSLTYGTRVDKVITRDNINYAGEISGDKEKVVVYFEGTANGLESYFVPVTVPLEDVDGVVGVNLLDALDALVQGPPEGSGLFSEIPKDTKIVSVDVNNGIAYINLTEEILEIVDNYEMTDNVTKSFGLTVREQYQDIAGVKLMVNGKELKLGENKEKNPVVVPTFANQY